MITSWTLYRSGVSTAVKAASSFKAWLLGATQIHTSMCVECVDACACRWIHGDSRNLPARSRINLCDIEGRRPLRARPRAGLCFKHGVGGSSCGGLWVVLCVCLSFCSSLHHFAYSQRLPSPDYLQVDARLITSCLLCLLNTCIVQIAGMPLYSLRFEMISLGRSLQASSCQ